MKADRTSPISRLIAALLLLLMVGAGFGGDVLAQSSVRPPDDAVILAEPGPVEGDVPGGVSGPASDSDLWRAIRQGGTFATGAGPADAGAMIQSEGELWRLVRTGPLLTYGWWPVAGMAGLLILFYLIRGRIRIEQGRSGQRITRFGAVERFGHWLLAVSFIILAITGLALLYGRSALTPAFGKELFATIALYGKQAHNYVAFAFVAGLAITFLTWVVHNLPSRVDLNWLAVGGGLFSSGVHPPAKKFNAGQKIIFWLVMLLGGSMVATGAALLAPHLNLNLFSLTFEGVNWLFGTNLPDDLGARQEMQLTQLWHAIIAIVMTAVILAHIYLGSIGMEGAFDAMGSGEVDLNWAREHHSLWVEEVEREAGAAAPDRPAAPAE